MKKATSLIAVGFLTSLFALVFIFFISSYAIKEGNDAIFYFLFMPIIILIIGVMIFRHGIHFKKNHNA